MSVRADLFRASAVSGRPVPRSERRARVAPVQARRAVPLAELLRQMNRELATRRDCLGLEVYAGGVREGPPDVDGCNWNPAGLRVHVTRGAATYALGGLREVVDWARLNFDLVESGA